MVRKRIGINGRIRQWVWRGTAFSAGVSSLCQNNPYLDVLVALKALQDDRLVGLKIFFDETFDKTDVSLILGLINALD